MEILNNDIKRTTDVQTGLDRYKIGLLKSLTNP